MRRAHLWGLALALAWLTACDDGAGEVGRFDARLPTDADRVGDAGRDAVFVLDAGAVDAGALDVGTIGTLDVGALDAARIAVDAGRDSSATTGSVSYTTNFDLTERPVREGGAWSNVGQDWTFIETRDGAAFGTQTGTNGYDDSYAHLSGFPANHEASAVIYRGAGIDPGCTHEVEILLRWSDSAGNAHGYECNLAWDGGYAQIVRWNGARGDFTYLAWETVSRGVHDGDTLSASVVGNLITMSLNGTEIAHATDDTFTTGNPGMAFWLGGPCSTHSEYGFTSYTAHSID